MGNIDQEIDYFHDRKAMLRFSWFALPMRIIDNEDSPSALSMV